jgi:hypothetical protein
MDTKPRKLLGAAAFSLALAGGGVAGALLGTPGTSGAQDETTTTVADNATTPTPADAEGRPHGPGQGGPRLDAAAEAIGITADELKTELEAGKSIAQVAEAHGVDAQTVIDALVAAGKEHLAEMEAELPDRVTELVNREGLPERGRHGGPRGEGGRPPAAGAQDDAAATTSSSDS